MQSNYKVLGPYIRPVNVRNSDLKVERLLGVSIQKILMPSIANTVGTNMKSYKVIKHGQFAYGPVTSRNGDKISVALLEDFEEAIVSQAYTVFEVIDRNELDPEYLMMWFRRPEFDRYARFKSHGSAREVFDWEEMCEVELPIPPIEKQREIVAEYNTVVNRIKLNEQLNQKLEETAQALYKHWFVDFEFPISAEQAASMGKPNLEGKPYKSSGGKMVFNAELDKKIPEGWVSRPLDAAVAIKHGFAFKGEFISEHENRNILLSPGNFKIGGGFKGDKYKYYTGEVPSEFILKPGDLIVTMTDLSKAGDTLGYPAIIPRKLESNYLHNQRLGKVNIKADAINPMFIYWMLRTNDYRFHILGSATGTTVRHTSPSRILEFKYCIPEDSSIVFYYSKMASTLNKHQEQLLFESELLQSFLETHLSKMTQVQPEKETA